MFFGTVSMHAQCTVTVSGTTVKMSNGTLSAEISGQAYVKKLNLGGINLLTSNGIYYDYTTTDGRRLNFTKAQLVRKSDDQVEVQFIDDTSDIRCREGFIMRRGVSGLYVYVILEGTSTSGDIHMKQTRVVCRPNGNQFSYGYVTDDMQGEMPSVATMKWLNQNAATQKTQDAAYRLQDGSIYTSTIGATTT